MLGGLYGYGAGALMGPVIECGSLGWPMGRREFVVRSFFLWGFRKN